MIQGAAVGTFCVAEVWTFASVVGESLAIVSLWEFVSEDTDSATSVWTAVNTNTELREISEIACALTYKVEGSTALVLVPIPYRGKLS